MCVRVRVLSVCVQLLYHHIRVGDRRLGFQRSVSQRVQFELPMLVGSSPSGRFPLSLFLLLLQFENFGVFDDGVRIRPVGHAVVESVHSYAIDAFAVNALIKLVHFRVGEWNPDFVVAEFEVGDGSVPRARHQFRSTSKRALTKIWV